MGCFILINYLIKKLNRNTRGNISRQIDRLYEAFIGNKNGPLLFSGEIKVVPDYGYLHFFKYNSCPNLQNITLDKASIIQILNLKRLKAGSGIVKADLLLNLITNKPETSKSYQTIGGSPD